MNELLKEAEVLIENDQPIDNCLLKIRNTEMNVLERSRLLNFLLALINLRHVKLLGK